MKIALILFFWKAVVFDLEFEECTFLGALTDFFHIVYFIGLYFAMLKH
jgi:hypothetical protein